MASRMFSPMLLPALAYSHDAISDVNPLLGVPGFPDCVRLHPELELSVEDAAKDLSCAQRAADDAALKIGCIGDSITAGAHSSSGDHTYPAQLQSLLDQAHGEGAYSVTNLGACGSTMLKNGNSPYWERPQYQTLTSSKWDIVVIMLGTNDAKDPESGGPDNWQHDCGGQDATTLEGCSFAEDYAAMIDLVRTLGTSSDGPKIYAMIPPPLIQQGAYGMNKTVINGVYPKLVPLIKERAGVLGPIDVYSGMGGVPDWESTIPDKCDLSSASTFAPCAWYCDSQSCDQCHPNDDGYHQLATVVQAGLGLQASELV